MFKGELDFLNAFAGKYDNRYQSAEWLKSNFRDNEWKCQFKNVTDFIISFKIPLYDGSTLSDPQHEDFCNTIKSFLCLQTHIDCTGGVILSPVSARNKINLALHLIDYFLLNGQRLAIAQYGFRYITENDLKSLIALLSTSSSISETIYKWPERLSAFLRDKILGMNAKEAADIISDNPFLLSTIPDECDRTTSLSAEEILLARAWLWKNGYYRKRKISGAEYNLKTRKIASQVFLSTLTGGITKTAREFQLVKAFELFNEFDKAPVWTGPKDKFSTQRMSKYLNCLQAFGLLSQDSTIPYHHLKMLSSKNSIFTAQLKPTGRVRTIPPKIVLSALRSAIEFFESYGEDIVTAYISVLAASKSLGLSCAAYCKANDISFAITPKLKVLGVQNWLRDNSGKHASSETYFSSLRATPGLYDLLRVLYGAILITVGALTARRESELLGLLCGRALDTERTRIVFANAKSGSLGINETEIRPIPKIAADMLTLLESLNCRMRQIEPTELSMAIFSQPSSRWNRLLKVSCNNPSHHSIDMFCDYFEIPLNSQGQRYYFRQHQLRRFFAMAFFWSNSFGGMEVLRWFLGHTDIEHLYHYITEPIGGEVLRTIKAQYGRELVTSNAREAEPLATLIESRFKTRNFSVLDHDELDEYIEELLFQRRLKIEPEFFHSHDGKNFRIAITTSQEGEND
jgi:hypothetical protein